MFSVKCKTLQEMKKKHKKNLKKYERWTWELESNNWFTCMYLAMTNSSLTILAPSPMNFWTNSEPETRIKVHSVWCATARARSVFPVPGGPYSNTPWEEHTGIGLSAHNEQPVILKKKQLWLNCKLVDSYLWLINSKGFKKLRMFHR